MKRTLFSISAACLTGSTAFAMAEGGEAHGPSWLPEWLSHPETNVAFVALLIFLGFMWFVGGFRFMGGALDKRAEAIEAQLNEAKDLNEAATKVLAEAERQQKQADKDAKEIVAQAKKDAEMLMAEAREALAQRLERREALAEARIKQAESEAAAQVRNAAADAATRAARNLVAGNAGSDQFEAAAQEIENALN